MACHEEMRERSSKQRRMGGEMNNKCLGVFLVVITIPLVMLSIIQLSSVVFLKSKFYKELFQKSKTYEAVVNAMPKSPNNGDLIGIIQNKMTPDWLQSNVENNLDALFLFVGKDAKRMDLSIDIKPFRDDIAAGLPAEAQKYVPETLSVETYNQFLSQTQGLMDQVSTIAAESGSDVDKQIAEQKKASNNFNQTFENNANSIKKGFTYLKIAIYIVYALTLIMLLIIILVSRHYIPAIFRWTGATIFISGLLTFTLSLVLSKIVLGLNLIDRFKLGPEIKAIINPLFNNATANFAMNLGRVSLAVVIFSAVMIIFSYVLAAFVKPAPVTPQPIAPPAK